MGFVRGFLSLHCISRPFSFVPLVVIPLVVSSLRSVTLQRGYPRHLHRLRLPSETGCSSSSPSETVRASSSCPPVIGDRVLRPLHLIGVDYPARQVVGQYATKLGSWDTTASCQKFQQAKQFHMKIVLRLRQHTPALDMPALDTLGSLQCLQQYKKRMIATSELLLLCCILFSCFSSALRSWSCASKTSAAFSIPQFQ
ncbi:hypothetical protein ACLOJK_012669 [Asimina triloba]